MYFLILALLLPLPVQAVDCLPKKRISKPVHRPVGNVLKQIKKARPVDCLNDKPTKLDRIIHGEPLQEPIIPLPEFELPPLWDYKDGFPLPYDQTPIPYGPFTPQSNNRTSVPEPVTWTLFSAGLITFFMIGRKRKRYDNQRGLHQ